MMWSRGVAQPHKSRRGRGLSIHKFAAAKQSTYDKRAKLEKRAALKAGKVNKLRKLKERLAKEGKLEPILPPGYLEQQAEEESDTARARRRAGPAPDDSQSEPSALSEDVDLVEDAASPAGQQDVQSPGPFSGPGKEADLHLHLGGKGAEEGPDQLQRHKKGRRPKTKLQRIRAEVLAKQEAQEKVRSEAQRAAEERRQRVEEVERQRKQKKKQFLKKTRTGQPVMKFRIEDMLGKLQQDLQQ